MTKIVMPDTSRSKRCGLAPRACAYGARGGLEARGYQRTVATDVPILEPKSHRQAAILSIVRETAREGDPTAFAGLQSACAPARAFGRQAATGGTRHGGVNSFGGSIGARCLGAGERPRIKIAVCRICSGERKTGRG